MHKATHLLALIASILIVITSHTPAQAQLLHTWVASNGSDAANCDRPTPCASFSGAYGKTTAGGEITCVDSGNYGLLSISKALTVNCEAAIGSNAGAGGGSTGSFVVGSLAATDVVILRGLDLDDGNQSGTNALVSFFGGGTLRLEKIRVASAPSSMHGVFFVPADGAAKLHVMDSVISNIAMSGAPSGLRAGIFIAPNSGLQATVVIERSVIDNNQFGIFADGTSGGTIRGVVKDSVVSGNTNNGISVNTNGTVVGLMVDNTLVSGNNYGLAAGGTKGLILVRRSTITANNNGLSAGGGGQVVSYRDNSLNNNTVDGAFSFAIGTQ
jgi:hypothetical protein